MQHLPFLPQTPVPFLGGPTYKGEGLEEFIKNNGWSHDRLKEGAGPDQNLENEASTSRLAFLQSCFNIAIIIEFLKIRGVDASHETFSPNGTIVDTTELPRLIDKMSIVLGANSVARGEQTSRVRSTLELIGSCMPEIFPETTDAISIPMLCMTDTIYGCASILGFQESVELNNKIYTASRPIKQMIEAGWCPRQLSELDTICRMITRHYVSTIKRTPKFTCHTQCTPHRCVSSNLDSNTYRTAHVSTCNGDCRFIGIDQEDLLIFLEQNIVPRIYIRIPKDTSPQPEPELAVRGSGQYMAISHVWSHGLGHPQENSLPACQLRRIVSLMEEVNQQTQQTSDLIVEAFWIDTLCVPISKKAKQRALSFIRRTFNQSTRTVILDYEIERISHRTPSHEIMWRLTLSDWARRLWTYEEFVVSKERALLKLKDSIVSLDKLITDLYPTQHPMDEYKYNPLDMLELTDEFKTFAILHSGTEEHRMHLTCLLLQKVGRLTTSRWEDETLCLTSMLDLETKSLAALPAEERMEVFLAQLRSLPLDILFGYNYRLKTPGYRWAPESFLVDYGGQGFDPLCSGQYRSVKGDDDMKGFVVSLPGLMLTKYASRVWSKAVLQVPGAPPRVLLYAKPIGNPSASRIEWLMGLHKADDLEDNIQLIPTAFESEMKLIMRNTDIFPALAILVHSKSKIFDGAECVEFVARIDIADVDDPSSLTEQDEKEGLRVEKGNLVHATPIPTQR